MKNLVIVVGVVLVGSLSGVLGSLLLGRAHGRPPTAPAEKEERELSLPVPFPYPASFAKLNRSVPARVDEGEPKARAKEPSSEAPPTPEPFDRAAATERVKKAFAEKLAGHSAQPANPAWSKSTEGVLRRGLENTAKTAGFRVSSVDCRTTSCVADLEWDTYSAMRQNLHTAVESSYDTLCARAAMPPDEGRAGDKVTVPLILDCADWKSQGSISMSEAAGRAQAMQGGESTH